MIGGVHQGTDKAVSAMHVSNERARTTLEMARAAGEALDGITAAISQISERNTVVPVRRKSRLRLPARWIAIWSTSVTCRCNRRRAPTRPAQRVRNWRGWRLG